MSPIGLECSPIGLRKIEKWDKILKCKVRQQSNRRPSESARVQRSDSAVRQSLKIVKLVRIKVSRTLKSPSRTLFSTRKSDKNAKWSDNSVGLFLVRRSPIRSPIGLNSVRSDSDGPRRSQKGVKVASDCCRSPSESDRSPSESVGVRKWSDGRPTESVGPKVTLYTLSVVVGGCRIENIYQLIRVKDHEIMVKKFQKRTEYSKSFSARNSLFSILHLYQVPIYTCYAHLVKTENCVIMTACLAESS